MLTKFGASAEICLGKKFRRRPQPFATYSDTVNIIVGNSNNLTVYYKCGKLVQKAPFYTIVYIFFHHPNL